MIDKVLVLTLERCIERQRTWLGASQMRDIPLEHISFIKGHDGKDYEDMSEIAQAASADGFDFVEEYALGTTTEYVHQTPGSVSQVWNYGRILRHISERSEVCLILHDDKMINLSFNILNIIVSELLNIEDEEFFAFQLVQRGDLNEIAYENKDRFELDEMSKQIFSAIFNQAIPSYKEFFLKKGIAGYDETMVLSPEGANWILNCLSSADDFYIFYDHFVHKRLTTEAALATQNGKGIYCPRLSGYKFASEIMFMETTTDYAPEGSLHYEQSKLNTEITWENIR